MFRTLTLLSLVACTEYELANNEDSNRDSLTDSTGSMGNTATTQTGPVSTTPSGSAVSGCLPSARISHGSPA